MATPIEVALAELCEKHDLTSITVGMNLKQREASRFDCAVHYDGHSARGIGCSAGHAGDVQTAIARAITIAAADRRIPLVDAPNLTLEAEAA